MSTLDNYCDCHGWTHQPCPSEQRTGPFFRAAVAEATSSEAIDFRTNAAKFLIAGGLDPIVAANFVHDIYWTAWSAGCQTHRDETR